MRVLLIALFTLCASTVVYSQQIISDYHLDGSLIDSAMSSNSLQNFGTGTSYSFEKGNLNQQSDSALKMNGGVGLRSTATFQNSSWNGYCVSTWIKGNGSGNIYQGAHFGGGLTINSDGTLYCFFSGSATSKYTSNKKINDNKWHHIVAQSNGDTVFMYIDGVLEGKKAERMFKISTPNSNAKMHIGTNSTQFNVLDSFSISRLTVYNDALTLTQINNLNKYGTLDTPKTNSLVPELFSNEKLVLYPNPASQVVTIKGLIGEESIKIIDIEGSVVKYETVNKSIVNHSVDISDLEQGVYFLQAGQQHIRFVKSE